jgi:quercetin dioxygenase-like cupin family protein
MRHVRTFATLPLAALVLVQPVIVPVDQEPQHHPVFRNETLAVIDVRFPPGYTSLFHRHSNDNVSVRIATAPTRTDTLTDMTAPPQTAPVGRLVFNSATPPYVHRVANLGDTEVHIVDIEVLARTRTRRADVADDLAGHEVVVDNDRVRLSRVVLTPGTVLPGHRHPIGWLEVEVRGDRPGRYRWHDAGDQMPLLAAGAAPLETAEIEIK